MKRLLFLLSLACTLLLAGSCHYDVNLSVQADAELSYANGDVIRIAPVLYEGFHHKYLSDNDLEDIFIDLTKHASDDFLTAVMHLYLYDEIGGKFLREETYGVVYNSHTGHYDFADLDIIY